MGMGKHDELTASQAWRRALHPDQSPSAGSVTQRPLSSVLGPVLLAVGQVVVPLVGWVVGIVVIVVSPVWRPREKFLMFAAPLVGLAALGAGALARHQPLLAAPGAGYSGPSAADFFPSAPLLAGAVLPFLIANVIVAIFLAAIAIHRTRARVSIPGHDRSAGRTVDM
jgi:hypothetical protein